MRRASGARRAARGGGQRCASSAVQSGRGWSGMARQAEVSERRDNWRRGSGAVSDERGGGRRRGEQAARAAPRRSVSERRGSGRRDGER
eukprot:scaffold19137_cov41-Phaeocystis_antarctica.AAC.2